MSRLTGPILALVALMVSACAGFTPMYAEPGVVAGLERIAVQAPDTRAGYLLRERLEDAFGRDASAEPVYRLRTQLRERRNPLGRRADDTATRYEQNLTLSYVLTDARTQAQVHADTLTVTTTYAASTQPYAGVVAQQDGAERAAAQAADLIRSDLARVLAERARGE